MLLRLTAAKAEQRPGFCVTLKYFEIKKAFRYLLRSLSEAATLFLTDRAGPGRFIICDLSRSDFFHGR